MQSRRGSGVLAVVIASLLWGTTGTTATFLPQEVSPLATGAATMGVGGLLLVATAPDRADRVDDKARRQAVAARQFRLPGLAAVERSAFGE